MHLYNAMASTPFTQDGCLHDLTTYWGRVRHFQELINPSTLFTTKEELEHAKALLDNFDKFGKGTMTDDELWAAQRLCQSVLHPQTKEEIPSVFRLSAFIPMNIQSLVECCSPVPPWSTRCFGNGSIRALTPASTTPNRSASPSDGGGEGEAKGDEGAVGDIAKAYGMAVMVSCGTAVGLGNLVSGATAFSPAVKTVIQRCVPFTAVASAGVFNAVAMRYNELVDGIEVVDEGGVAHGRSVLAARAALTDVALTRIAIPAPLVLLPPVLIAGLDRARVLPAGRVPRALAEIGVITACMVGAFPAAVAIFPQTGTIAASALEPQFQKTGVKNYFYNKGI